MFVHGAMELEGIHWWLPLEILEDIGIANADELRTMAVVEELASRLTAVLGSAMKRGQGHSLPLAREANSYQPQCPPQPQVFGLDSRGHVTRGGNVHRSRVEAQPFFNNGGMQGMTVSLSRFAPARPPLVGAVPLLAMRRGVGTGVFLPPNGEVNHHMVRVDHAESHYSRQRCRQKKRQPRQLRLHADAMTASHMLEQQLYKNKNAVFFGCHDDLSLPQEWIY